MDKEVKKKLVDYSKLSGKKINDIINEAVKEYIDSRVTKSK